MNENPADGYVRVGYRSKCQICNEVLSAATEEGLREAHVEHLTHDLTDYCEREVDAGRMVRVIRDGQTLYREVADTAGEERDQ
jgi:hypothetical protein